MFGREVRVCHISQFYDWGVDCVCVCTCHPFTRDHNIYRRHLIETHPDCPEKESSSSGSRKLSFDGVPWVVQEL